MTDRERAYTAHRAGMTWEQIAGDLGVTKHGALTLARRYAREYRLTAPTDQPRKRGTMNAKKPTAKATQPATISNSQRVYELAASGEYKSWEEVAKLTDYKNVWSANSAAYAYAKRNNLPPVSLAGRKVAAIRNRIAYDMLSDGKTLQDVADHLRVSVGRARFMANKHAERNDLSPATVKIPPPTIDAKQKRAYTIRSMGHTWKVVAHWCGYTSNQTALNAAYRYASMTKSPWPVPHRNGILSDTIGKTAPDEVPPDRLPPPPLPPVDEVAAPPVPVTVPEASPADYARRQQELAYTLRAEGKSWPDVAKGTSYRSEGTAASAAQKHAKRNGLPWPIPLDSPPASVDRSLNRLGIDRARHRQQMAYEKRAAGGEWPDIAEELRYSSSSSASDAASRHARRHDLPWPLPTQAPATTAEPSPTPDSSSGDLFRRIAEGLVSGTISEDVARLAMEALDRAGK